MQIDLEDFATDQCGAPWIVVKRNGFRFALGFDDGGLPALRQMGDDWTVHLDLSKPEGIRNLTRANPS